jgi:hypothetical protein
MTYPKHSIQETRIWLDFLRTPAASPDKGNHAISLNKWHTPNTLSMTRIWLDFLRKPAASSDDDDCTVTIHGL